MWRTDCGPRSASSLHSPASAAHRGGLLNEQPDCSSETAHSQLSLPNCSSDIVHEQLSLPNWSYWLEIMIRIAYVSQDHMHKNERQ